jgi:hypothetical protein
VSDAKVRPDQTAKPERKSKERKSKDEPDASVDEQIEESFPASDPPSFNAGGARIGQPRRAKGKVSATSRE